MVYLLYLFFVRAYLFLLGIPPHIFDFFGRSNHEHGGTDKCCLLVLETLHFLDSFS